MKGFLEFIRTQGVMGLAVGFILGGAVSGVVKSLVDDIINPILGLLLSRVSALTDLTWYLGSATLSVGKFISILINFAVVAAVVYFGVKGLGLDKIDKKKE